MQKNCRSAYFRFIPRLGSYGLALALIVLLLGGSLGCESKKENPFPAMSEAIVLSLQDYQDMSKGERLKAVNVLSNIVFLSKEDLPKKPSQIAKEMLDSAGADGYPVDEPGSALAVFCVLTDENPETYLRLDTQAYPTLAEAMELRVNDLTGRLYSIGMPGMYVLIDALYELEQINGDSHSVEYFGPKMTLKVRSAVEEVNIAKIKNNYTSSGEIDYEEAGGYLRQLCKLLELDFDTVYPQMEELALIQTGDKAKNEAARAAQAAKQAELDQNLAQELIGEHYSKSGWQLSLAEDGFYYLTSTQEVKFSIGGWEVKDGELLLGETPARLTEQGIFLEDIEEPFTRQNTLQEVEE